MLFKVNKLTNNGLLNFSLWVDYIEKSFVDGKLRELIDSNTVTGATSNPSIFKEAFSKTEVYANDLANLTDKNSQEKYDFLAINEIKRAAGAFRGVYDKSEQKDGFVSIEINPFLANNIDASITEGKRLFEAIDEPNVMIKVPATQAGYSVVEELLRANIPVNVTLIFSPNQAKSILERVISIKDRTKPVVISIFVSRFDRLLNDKLPNNMKNLVGIMNSALIYDIILRSNVSNIKTLFASTGVKKEQNLPNDYYITKLLAPNSINTAPIGAIEAFSKNDAKQSAPLPLPKSKILGFFDALSEYVDINNAYDELVKDGLSQFERSFAESLESL